ncbi:clathrin heavy chain 2-like isoform X3 [Centruroides sculpturatus]|uniref:clathrin heavy chain 2-like isoform X3 n=1 Tax=Centruroides sculpturatus TaxID=218467 RepID=UPI000C6DEF98|nr:clathrin heavy chain 2-like isoform X3 [Centruroides sculpturatus]
MLQPVLYWTWINSSIIAFVTDTAVYHWNLLQEKCAPQRIFYCHPCVTGTQFINYTTDKNKMWFALTGLSLEDNNIIGNTQIYSVEYNLSQPIQAHCVCFCQYQFEGNTQPSTVLVVANRGSEKTGKIHVLELGPQLSGNLAAVSHSGTIEFSDLWDLYDFPVSIQVSAKYGLAYVVTKYGTLHIYDLETAAHLATHTVCTDIIFTTTLHHDTQGILAISRNGQVLAVDVKRETLINHVRDVIKKPHIAERLKRI